MNTLRTTLTLLTALCASLTIAHAQTPQGVKMASGVLNVKPKTRVEYYGLHRGDRMTIAFQNNCAVLLVGQALPDLTTDNLQEYLFGFTDVQDWEPVSNYNGTEVYSRPGMTAFIELSQKRITVVTNRLLADHDLVGTILEQCDTYLSADL